MKKLTISMLCALMVLCLPLLGSAGDDIWYYGRDNGKISLKTAAFTLGATGTVVSAVTGKTIKVYAVKLVTTASVTVAWRNGGATALEGNQVLAANAGYTESVTPPAYLFSTSSGTSLDLVTTGSGTASGRVSYWTDDAY